MKAFNKFNLSLESNERFKKIEYILIICYLSLLTISYFTIKSSTLNTSLESRASKQLIWIAIGLIFYLFFIFFPERYLKGLIPFIFYFFILCLGAVLLTRPIYGARRWIRVGPFGFQPSEFFKVAEILYLSYIVSYKKKHHFLFSSILIFFSCGLIYKEPDLGTTLIVVAIWFIIMFVSGKYEFTWKLFFSIGLFLSPVVFLFLKDYQKARLISFIFPQNYSNTIAYNSIQAIRAIGAGGLTGTGYMNGYMNLGHFVPENDTDFIITVIGEEFGFIGISIVLLIFGLIFWRLYKAYKNSTDDFWKYFYIGTAFLLFFHIFENIGMNSGIMPITGVPLPLVSYGGSPTLSFSILFGIATKGAMINKNLKKY